MRGAHDDCEASLFHRFEPPPRGEAGYPSRLASRFLQLALDVKPLAPNNIALSRPGPSSRPTYLQVMKGKREKKAIIETHNTPTMPPPPMAGRLAAMVL